MSKLKLEYEILISGIYPFDGVFEKNGFKIVKNTIDEKLFNSLSKESVIYLSPFIGMCCYQDSNGSSVYLTFRKEEVIEIDYGEAQEYDGTFTSQHIESLNLYEAILTLEKTIVLEVNNDIKFPIKMIKACDPWGNLVTSLGEIMKLNITSLLNTDHRQVLEVMKRQNNRLSSGISYKKITELAQGNKYFNNSLKMYYSSFNVSDCNAGFTLLVIALESLLGLSTYSKPDKCTSCGQTKYAITSTVSQNVSLILMDHDGVIKKRIKALYSVRSKFVHKGKEVAKQDEQEIQEYVRKVLLMYWYVSMGKTTFEHKNIMDEIQSVEYKENSMYQSFLTGLDNTSFDEKRIKIFSDILSQIAEE